MRREIVNITNESADVITITRAYEACPLSSSSIALQQIAQEFEEGDLLEVVLSKKCLDDIEDELARIVDEELPLKLDKSVYDSEKQAFKTTST